MAPTPRVILVVDDEPCILTVLEKALARAGYSVIAAPGPEEAIKRSRGLDCEIDLLLTDVVMPEMDGVGLARLLASERPGLRVLLMSGYSPRPSKFPFLAKPFEIDVLIESVSNVLEGPPAFDRDPEGDEKTSSRASLAGS